MVKNSALWGFIVVLVIVWALFFIIFISLAVKDRNPPWEIFLCPAITNLVIAIICGSLIIAKAEKAIEAFGYK